MPYLKGVARTTQHGENNMIDYEAKSLRFIKRVLKKHSVNDIFNIIDRDDKTVVIAKIAHDQLAEVYLSVIDRHEYEIQAIRVA